MIAQMERAAGFRHGDETAARLDKLQALLAATAPPMEDVALIADLHSAAVSRSRAVARCYAAAQEGEDVRGTAAAGRRSGPAAAGADGVR